jgi:hypothetical protein
MHLHAAVTTAFRHYRADWPAPEGDKRLTADDVPEA